MVFVIVFVAFLDNMMQQPLISPMAQSLGAQGLFAGAIYGAYSLANIVGNTLTPSLVARFQLKKTLVGAMLVVGAALFMYTLLRTPQQMLALRVIHGIGGGVVVPCIFTHVSFGQRYGIGMSKVGRVIGLTAVLGPASAGLLSARFGYGSPFMIVGFLFLAAILMVLRLPDRREALDTLGSLAMVWHQDGLRVAYASAFSLMFSMGMLGFWFPLQMASFGFGSHHIGSGFLVFGVAAIAVMRLGAVRSMTVPMAVLMAGFTCVFAGMALLSWVNALPIIYLALASFGIGFGLVFPAMNILVVKETNAQERASGFAVFHGFFSLAVFSAALVGGLVHQWVHPFHVVLLVLVAASLVFGRVGFRWVSRTVS